MSQRRAIRITSLFVSHVRASAMTTARTAAVAAAICGMSSQAGAQATFVSQDRFVEVRTSTTGEPIETETIQASGYDPFEVDFVDAHSADPDAEGRARQVSTLSTEGIWAAGEAWGTAISDDIWGDGTSYCRIEFEVDQASDFFLSGVFEGLGEYHFNGPSISINQEWEYLDDSFFIHDYLAPGTYVFEFSCETNALPGATYAAFDVAFEIVPTDCPGDANGDFVVDVADILAVLAAWGSCDDCAEDLDDDGLVTVTDLLEVLAHWGPCAVP